MTITTESKSYTDEERIEHQSKCVAEHCRLENAHEPDRVVEETFVKDGAFYDVAAGLTHYEGIEGVADFYDMLFSVLPDIHITYTRSYDVPGCSIREGFMTGTHSAEYAGIPASGNSVTVPFAGFYLFGEDPTRMMAERAYWDNDGMLRQMRGEEDPVTGTPWEDSAL